jgi:hypothetical protein
MTLESVLQVLEDDQLINLIIDGVIIGGLYKMSFVGDDDFIQAEGQRTVRLIKANKNALIIGI